MKDTQFEAEHDYQAETHSPAYLRAVQEIEDKTRRQEQRGYATMMMAASLAGGVREGGGMGPVARAAQLFCITFAFVAPNVLMILYAF